METCRSKSLNEDRKDLQSQPLRAQPERGKRETRRRKETNTGVVNRSPCLKKIRNVRRNEEEGKAV